MTAIRAARVVVRAAVGVLLLLEVLLAMTVLLQVLGANPDAGFADWTYRNADSFTSPFEDLFDPVELSDDEDDAGDSANVLDVSTLFAMGVYAAGFIPLAMLLGWIERGEARVELRRQQAVDDARHSRLFGSHEPDAGDQTPEAPEPGLVDRVRAWLRRGDR